MRIWLRSLFRTFSTFELTVLEALVEALPERASRQLREQIAAVKRVVRLPGWIEANCYPGPAGFPEESRFPGQADLELARVTVRDEEAGVRYDVRVFSVAGHIFQLVTRPAPRAAAFHQRLHVESVELLDDPLEPSLHPLAPPPEPMTTEHLTGWVRDLAGLVAGTLAFAPLPAAERSHAVDLVDATLPTQFLELLDQTDGLVIPGRCVIPGAREVRTVYLTDADYYLIAHAADAGMLGLRRGDPSGTLFRIGFDDAPPTRLETTFPDALVQLIQEASP